MRGTEALPAALLQCRHFILKDHDLRLPKFEAKRILLSRCEAIHTLYVHLNEVMASIDQPFCSTGFVSGTLFNQVIRPASHGACQSTRRSAPDGSISVRLHGNPDTILGAQRNTQVYLPAEQDAAVPRASDHVEHEL